MISVMPKKSTGRKKANRTGVALGCYIDADIRKSMDDYIAKYNETAEHPASVRSTVEAALRAFLSDRGFWKAESPK
ncbi:unnamed protein product [Gemmata massiliana]|uniref:Uncharacterized protein n=1 Tax=Gemmata massiliana TaxID=1210884 RepID=A0A6P2CYF9_9BACT|nr:hypothetical protein [Gemmata massiliana]VTR92172.1 unnamed protein product [Gemmata massiliana]